MKASRDCIDFHGNKLSQSKSRRLLPGSLCDAVLQKAHAVSGHMSMALLSSLKNCKPTNVSSLKSTWPLAFCQQHETD